MNKRGVVKARVIGEDRVLSPALAQALAHVKDFMTDSQKASILGREGKTLMDAGDIKGAVECFNEGISYNPTVSLFSLRATAHKLMELYTEAYYDYSYNIRLEPENGVHYCNRGLCLSKLKKIALALEDFEVAIQYDPSPTHYYSRATTYADFGKFEQAIAGILAISRVYRLRVDCFIIRPRSTMCRFHARDWRRQQRRSAQRVQAPLQVPPRAGLL
jgi:tetratricopeptide (TPR) repeat protein